MTQTEMNRFVALRTQINAVVPLLNAFTRYEFVQAVQPAATLSAVPQPYRKWITDHSAIPDDNRSLVHPTATQTRR